MNFHQLALQAARAAARLRADNQIRPTDSICPFDFAEQLGIVVRLAALPSMEGMYSPTPRPTILVSSERPSGRRRYTCGHEIGHHVFGHGTRLDELETSAAPMWTEEEFLAQRFSASLLMPKLAIEAAFARRGWSMYSPRNILVVAREFGVGYGTLVKHLQHTLGRIPASIGSKLLRVSLRKLRGQVAGRPIDHDVVVVDLHWRAQSIDIEVGDVIVLPESAECEGRCVIETDGYAKSLLAVEPGIGGVRLSNGDNQAMLRVSRRGFVGLSRYRFLEEVTDE